MHTATRALAASLLLATLPLLTGCPGFYVQPTDPQLSAELTLVASGAASNSYYAYEDDSCIDTETTGALGSFGSIFKEKEKLTRIRTGVPIYVQAASAFGGIECTNVASFVPQVGGKYRMQQKFDFERRVCYVSLIDELTNAEIPTESPGVKGKCKNGLWGKKE